MVTADGSTNGRPKSTFEVVIREDFGFLDITEPDAVDISQWRRRIHVADTN